MHKALFILDRTSGISLQDQLREKIATAIIDGYYGPDRPLPSTRKLSKDLGISRNTVNAVYQSLVEEGILQSRERSHYRVNPDLNLQRAFQDMQPKLQVGPKPQWAVKILRGGAAPAVDWQPPDWKNQPHNFVFGELDSTLFPLAAWRHCSRQTLAKTQIADWPWDQSGSDDPMLIEYLRRVVLPMRGIRAKNDEILVTAGTQNSIFLLASLLTDARTTVAIENPCNPEVWPLFTFSGANIRPIAVDDEGLVPGDALSGCNYCYLRPAAQSPTVARLSQARRAALFDWALAEDGILLENDDDGEFNYRGRTMPAMKAQDSAERVIYFASFRGLLGGGIRLGYIVAPQPVIRELRNLRRRVLRHIPSNNQRTAALFIAGGFYESTLLRLNNAYAARWNLMWHALREHLPDATTFQPPGGQGYWLKFAEGTDTGALAKRCLDRGIFVTGGVPWFYDAPDRLNYLRLGFTAIQDQHIVAGIEGIAAASRETA